MKDFERIDKLSEQMDKLEKAFYLEIKRLDEVIEKTTNPIHKSIHVGIQNSLYLILGTMLDYPKIEQIRQSSLDSIKKKETEKIGKSLDKESRSE